MLTVQRWELKEPTLLLHSHNHGYEMEMANAYMLLIETVATYIFHGNKEIQWNGNLIDHISDSCNAGHQEIDRSDFDCIEELCC